MIITIINGYGVFDEKNSIYKNYLNQAIKIIEKNISDKIICTGGFTNKNINISEAASMANYIISQKSEFEKNIILEEKAFTTPQNYEFSREIIKNNNLKPTEIHAIGDSARLPLLIYDALTVFYDLFDSKINEKEIYETYLKAYQEILNFDRNVNFKYKNWHFHGIFFNRSKEELSEIVFFGILNPGMLKYPDLHQKFIDWRKKKQNTGFLERKKGNKIK